MQKYLRVLVQGCVEMRKERVFSLCASLLGELDGMCRADVSQVSCVSRHLAE